ncbi:MAG: hypothetical protein IJ882_08175 [Paludibacteraceae bacterium]|nr:hypothetical protein [Paludibacteraceae bacterium]
MRAWLLPNYHVIEVQHDGSLFEQPALRYMQDYCKETGRPCLYIHTKGAYNRMEFSVQVRRMWRGEFTTKRDVYFGLVDRPFAAVACPVTGSDKTTWYNAFVANARAMAEIPEITPSSNRMKFERLFIKQTPQVYGVLRNDGHRELGGIDNKLLETLTLL